MEDRLANSQNDDYQCEQPVRYVDKNKYLPKETLSNYQNIPNVIKQWIVNSIHIFQNLKDIPLTESIPKCNLSIDDCICLVHDFYNWIPNKIYGQLVDKYICKNNLLRIQKKDDLEPILGCTFPFYYPYYVPFFLIENDNTINFFVTSNHEIAHGIYLASDNLISRNNTHSYLFELEGYFFDFLSNVFLKEKHIVSPKIINKLKYNETIDAITMIVCFYFQYLGIHIFENEKEIKIKSIKQKLSEQHLKLRINKDLMKAYLLEESDFLATYATSFLTNADLEYMASKDLERAFYNFERIRYNKTDNIRRNLTSNGISFMEDGYQNLQDKIAVLNRVKK